MQTGTLPLASEEPEKEQLAATEQNLKKKRLVNKNPAHVVPFEDREDRIKQEVRQTKIKKFIDAYHDKLLAEAVAQGRIKFLDEAIKSAVVENGVADKEE